MAVEGSDCVTGKRQYADRDTAKDAAQAGRARGWLTYSYRCPFCQCWHIGNRRGSSSKSRRIS
jgi:hypothetical protein